MRRWRTLRPSPSMAIAAAALVVALIGSAIAGPLASKSGLTKREKKQTRSLAQGEIAKAAPSLSVAKAANATNAVNADTLDGLDSTQLRTSSTYSEVGGTAALPSGELSVVSAAITTHSQGRILAVGAVEVFGADSDESAGCRILLDDEAGHFFSGDPDDIGTNSHTVISPTFAVTRPAGTYTAGVSCTGGGDAISREDASISVFALGP